MSTGRLSLDSGSGFVGRALPQASLASPSASAPAEPDGAAPRDGQFGASMFRGQPSELKLDGEKHAGNSRSGSRTSRG